MGGQTDRPTNKPTDQPTDGPTLAMTFLIETIRMGMKNLRLHLLRSVLTALGIVLGIAAVILMMAIAEGSKQSSLRQFEILGARNIILRSQEPPEQQEMTGGDSGDTSWITSYGLLRKDLRRIENRFQSWATHIVPLKKVGAEVTRKAQRSRSQAFGTTPELPECANFQAASGRYITREDMEKRSSRLKIRSIRRFVSTAESSAWSACSGRSGWPAGRAPRSSAGI